MRREGTLFTGEGRDEDVGPFKKGSTADADMVAGCVNGIHVLKMPRDLADALGFAVMPVKENEDSEDAPDE